MGFNLYPVHEFLKVVLATCCELWLPSMSSKISLDLNVEKRVHLKSDLLGKGTKVLLELAPQFLGDPELPSLK